MRIPIFAFWIIVTIVLAYWGLDYSEHTKMYFAAPDKTKSYDAQLVINETYDALTKQEKFVAMIVDKNGKYTNDKGLCMHPTIAAKLQETVKQMKRTMATGGRQEWYLGSADFYEAATNYQLAASTFCKANSTIIQAVYNASWDGMKEVIQLRKDLNKDFDKYLGEYKDDLEVQFLSISCMTRDIIDGTVSDMLTLDVISLVLGFIIVWAFIRQIQFLIISVVNLVESLIVSFAISCFIANSVDIPSFAAAVQSATVIALTFDYSLFLFSSVRTDLRAGASARTIIRRMLGNSGHVVIVSGLCLALTFAFQCICPVDIIVSIGLVTALTIIIIMLVSLSNTTAMLALFPKLFLHQKYDFNDMCSEGREQQPSVDYPLEDTKCTRACCIPRGVAHKQTKCELSITKFTSMLATKKWFGLLCIFIVVAIDCIFIYPVVKCKYTTSLKLAIPRHSKTIKAIEEFGKGYGDGLVAPFYVVLNLTVPGVKNTLLQQKIFDLAGKMSEDFITRSNKFFDGSDDDHPAQLKLNPSQLLAPFYYGHALSLAEVAYMMQNASLAPSLNFVLTQVTPNPSDLSTMSLMITPSVPITGVGLDQFVPFFRSVYEDYIPQFKQLGVQLTEYAYGCSMIDAIDKLFDEMPVTITIIAVVIVVIFILAFRSLLSALRLLVEMLMVQIFYIGMNTYIFQFGEVGGNNLSWASIFMMVCISIGLSCDYDIFSFSGIYKFYKKNLSQAKAAGVKINFLDSIMASADNLQVVMCAGLIMMVSFVGLLFSSIDILVQVASCLVFDLFFNCFFVVPVFIPAIAGLCGEATMFPAGKFIKAQKPGQTSSDSDTEIGAAADANIVDAQSPDRANVQVANE